MRLVSNRVEPNQVEETEEAYIIHDVPFLKPMHLSGGYVPRANVKETAEAWHGVPATLNHTRNEQGKPIPAERKPERHIGQVKEPTFTGEFVEAGTLRINKAALESLAPEAEQVQNALENGNPIEVSSQYLPKQLPPGEYDGKHRANVEKIVRPDSVAILPGQKGQCSIEDGCGINPEMVANADLSLTAADDPQGEDREVDSDMESNASADGIEYSGTAEGELDESEIPNDDFESHYVFDGETKSESSFPLVDADGNLRRGNVESAFNLRGHAEDEDKLLDVLQQVNDEFDTPPIDDEDFEDAMSANSGFISQIASFLGITQSTKEAESSTEPTDQSNSDMDRESKIEFITANSALTEESLTERCDDGLQAIYDDIEANSEQNDSDGDSDVTENNETVVELSESELDELIAEKAEEIVANREAQSQKEELAQEIVANSAEYDEVENVTDDYPTVPALEAKRDSLETGGSIPDMGVSANDLGDDIDVEPGLLGGD